MACAAVLAVLTALVMTTVARTLDQIPIASGAEAETIAAARNFYDSLNTVLQSGDVLALASHVAGDARITDGDSDHLTPLDELGYRLAEIGKAHPAVRLDITSLTVAGSDAVAIMRLTSFEDRLTASVVAGAAEVWTDRLRIRNGVVMELSGGTARLAPSEVLLDGEIQHTRSLAHVGVLRVTLESGGVMPVNTPGSLLAIVEGGNVWIDLDTKTAPAVTVAYDSPGVATEASESLVLGLGDRLSTLQSAGFMLRNEAEFPASLLLIAMLNPSFLDPASAPLNQTGSFASFLANGATHSTWQGPSGGTALMIARYEFATTPGAQRLHLEQIVLAQGSVVLPELKASDVSRIVLLVSEGAVIVEPQSGLPAAESGPEVIGQLRSVSLPIGTTQVRQAGSAPATLLFVRLETLTPTS